MNTILNVALGLAELGLDVLPVVASEKHPALSGWQSSATSDPAELGRVFAQANRNLAVATGARSRVWVLDVDVKGNARGDVSLAFLEERHGKLERTWCSVTPSGGLHYWWRYPRDRRVGNRVGCSQGLDVRGDGGFVLVPPSRLLGKPYAWKVEPIPEGPAAAPEWLLDLAAPLPPTTVIKPSSVPLTASAGNLSRYAEAALRGELERVETAPPGRRNHALFIASCALGTLVGAHLLALELAQAGLILAAEICGLVRDDGRRAVEATIASGLTRGMANPREVRR